MSQQMFDEERRGYQGGYASPETSGPSYEYSDPYAPHAPTGSQKIGRVSVTSSGRGPTAGQRLALAIVSVIALIALAGTILNSGGVPDDGTRLIAFGVVCLTVAAINFFFNRN